MATPTPPSLTLGKSVAHLSRCDRWTRAVFSQILCLYFAFALAYYVYKSEISPSPFSSNPWLLALLISLGAYFSLLCMVRDYAYLFLPRTPVAIVEKIHDISVGVLVNGGMVSAVLALQVRDARVLVDCNAVAHVSIVCLVVFWVWLALTYGGDASESESESSAVARLPV